MEKATIAIKLKAKHFSAVMGLAERVQDHLNGNFNFPSPPVSAATVLAEVNQLTEAIAKWGNRSNRGSHVDYVNLQSASVQMLATLKMLANYCESTVRLNVPAGEQESALTSSGFALKKPKSPQGRLEMVQNFCRFVARNIRQGDVKLSWSMPLNVNTPTNVRTYMVYRNTTNDLASAVRIKDTTAATITDTPGAGTWFYWVAPVNYMGEGVISNALKVTIV